MSTRCRISKLENDGSVKSIYCHWDGYPEYVGKVLQDCYNNGNINQLLELGDLSTLGKTPTTNKEDWDNPLMVSSVDRCKNYNDRGEKTHYKTHKSLTDFWKYCNDTDCDYIYILIDGIWKYVYLPYEKLNDLKNLEKTLAEIYKEQ